MMIIMMMRCMFCLECVRIFFKYVIDIILCIFYNYVVLRLGIECKFDNRSENLYWFE